MRRLLLTLLSLSAAAAAIWALVDLKGIGFDHLGERLAAAGPTALVLVALGSLVQVAISAHKWRLVLAALGTTRAALPGARLSLLLASLASIAAQVLPAFVAAPAMRGLAGRYASGLPVLQGAAASAVEQVFDVLAFSLMLMPTLVVFALALGGAAPGLGTWAALAGLVLAAGFTLTGTAAARLGRRLVRRAGAGGRLAAAFEALGRIDARLQRRLLAWSLLRYAAIFARVAAVVWAAGFAIPLAHLVWGHTVVQAAQLASVTPGNLGLAEWTWVGVLGYLGHDLAAVAIFSLTLRVVSVVSYVLVAAVVTAATAGPLLRDRAAQRR